MFFINLGERQLNRIQSKNVFNIGVEKKIVKTVIRVIKKNIIKKLSIHFTKKFNKKFLV